MSGRYAVMGNPIAHSLSPRIHQYFAKSAGIPLSYDAMLVAPASFESEVLNFFAQGGQGLNITLPFKQRAFAMAQILTPRCQQAKAANTLWMHAGQLWADNTDGIGLVRDLARYLDVRGKKLLLLGAGGAVRGILAALLAAAKVAKLTVTNRTHSKLPALQVEFPEIDICHFNAIPSGYDLLINATSVSLLTKTMPFPPALWQAATYYYDLAYCLEEETEFVHWARQQGRQAMDGLGMLVEQAAEAFYLWHGIHPDTTALLATLR